MPDDGGDTFALLALMWLGAFVESHSLAAASGLVLVVGTAGAIWYALR